MTALSPQTTSQTQSWPEANHLYLMKAIARKAALKVGLQLHGISAETLPTDLNQLSLLKCLLER